MADGRADNGNGKDDVSLPGGGVFQPQFNELGTVRDDSHTNADADATSANPFFDEYASDRRAPGAPGDRVKPTDQPVLVQQKVSDDGRVINEYHIYAQVLNINYDSRGALPASVGQMEGTGERLCHCGHATVRPGSPDGQLSIPIGGRTNYYGPQTYSGMYRNQFGEVAPTAGDGPRGDGRVTEQQIIAGLVTAGMVGRALTRGALPDVVPHNFPIPGRNPGLPTHQGQFGRPPFATPPFVDNSGGLSVTIDMGQPFRGGPDNFNNRFVSAHERHHTANENKQRAALRALAYHQMRARKGYDN